jgi:hypothetical protein
MESMLSVRLSVSFGAADFKSVLSIWAIAGRKEQIETVMVTNAAIIFISGR